MRSFEEVRKMATEIINSPKWIGEERTVGKLLEQGEEYIEEIHEELQTNDYEITFNVSYWTSGDNPKEATKKAIKIAMSELNEEILEYYSVAKPLKYNGCDWYADEGINLDDDTKNANYEVNFNFEMKVYADDEKDALETAEYVILHNFKGVLKHLGKAKPINKKE